VATLAELREALFPAAPLAAPADRPAGQVDVGWVRVMRARVPALDALERGDLVIVPGGALSVIAPGPQEVSALIETLAGASAAGVLLVPGEAGERSMEPLARGAVEAGLPVVWLTRSDPAALERSVLAFIVNRQAELDRQASRVEVELEELALRDADLETLVAAVGASLGRAVALEGRRGEVLVVHAPADVGDAAVAVRRYHAAPREAVALRVALPGSPAPPRPGRRGGSSGTLALLGDRPPSELDRAVAGRIAGLLALELAREEAIRRARDAARRGETLPTDGPPWVVLLARQGPPAGPPGIEEREAVRRDLRLLAPRRRMSLRGDAQSLELRAVLAAPSDDPGAASLAARIADFLGRTVALSRPFADQADRPPAEGEARATFEAAERLPDPPSVASAARLPAYLLMGSLHNIPDGRRQAEALLAPLLVGRPEARRERIRTLRALLTEPGPADAAAALGIHRNTLAYRARRIEERTGWRLSDPAMRLPLLLALELVQI
jgi:purine catabolism regulator